MTMSLERARAICSCSSCGQPAAEFSALRAGEGEGFLNDRDRLERMGWFGQCLRPLPHPEALALLEAIRKGELDALAREDIDLFGFFCRACGRAYCQACWTIAPPEFDDGLYDCTRGTCPAGHWQLLDD